MNSSTYASELVLLQRPETQNPNPMMHGILKIKDHQVRCVFIKVGPDSPGIKTRPQT